MSELTEIQQLRSEVEQLRAALEQLTPAPPGAAHEPEPKSGQPTLVPESAATRRNWIKAAAAARYGVHATHFSAGGTALRAAGGGTTGVGVNASGGTAVRSNGSLYGATLSGGLAALRFSPATIEPSARPSTHVAGEIEATAESASDPITLWLCTESGTPGTWRKLGGHRRGRCVPRTRSGSGLRLTCSCTSARPLGLGREPSRFRRRLS